MRKPQTFWVHPASFTCRLDRPDQLLETIWAERQGWGYLRRRDLWIQRECSLDELVAEGYVLRKALGEEDVVECRHCGMYMHAIPGSLVQKHISDCRGGNEDWQKLEDGIISEQRMKAYLAKILAEKLREQAELQDMERRERHDKISEAMLARQTGKDRKKRLKEETREDWKTR
ncbi:MAG: hypothetical protein ACLP5H_04245 [Desulfomonilaceae bacterium]